MSYTYGLTALKIADILPDGSTGTTFTTIGYTNQGTTKFVTNRGTANEKYCEELTTPLVSIAGTESIEIQTQVVVSGTSELLALLGGAVDTGVWSAPDTKPVIEKSVLLEPLAGLQFTIPRASIDGALNAALARTGDLFYIDLVMKVLQPTKAGVKKIKAEAYVPAG